jgi:hypothetical protein
MLSVTAEIVRSWCLHRMKQEQASQPGHSAIGGGLSTMAARLHSSDESYGGEQCRWCPQPKAGDTREPGACNRHGPVPTLVRHRVAVRGPDDSWELHHPDDAAPITFEWCRPSGTAHSPLPPMLRPSYIPHVAAPCLDQMCTAAVVLYGVQALYCHSTRNLVGWSSQGQSENCPARQFATVGRCGVHKEPTFQARWAHAMLRKRRSLSLLIT